MTDFPAFHWQQVDSSNIKRVRWRKYEDAEDNGLDTNGVCEIMFRRENRVYRYDGVTLRSFYNLASDRVGGGSGKYFKAGQGSEFADYQEIT